MESITCREITPEQTYPLRHKVMWPDKALSYVMLEGDNYGLHYGLFKGVELIAVVSLFIDGDDAQFRKFATLKREQGKGYGTTLLRFMLQQLLKHKVKRVWCNARTEKTKFYERFGLELTTQQFVKGGKSYVIMEHLFL